MEIELSKVDLVVLASAHNPSILSPAWIEENCLVDEKYKNFVNTPQFSTFDSETYNITIDHQRLQISLKRMESSLEQLAKIGAKYLELLPHIPYTALGLNFIWSAQFASDELTPKFDININGLNISNSFEGYDIELGCIIKAKKGGYILNLSIKPDKENRIVFNFNYHYDIKDKTVTKSKEHISELPEVYSDSYKIIEKLLRKERD